MSQVIISLYMLLLHYIFESHQVTYHIYPDDTVVHTNKIWFLVLIRFISLCKWHLKLDG